MALFPNPYTLSLSSVLTSSLMFSLVILLVILIVMTTLLFILLACAVFTFRLHVARGDGAAQGDSNGAREWKRSEGMGRQEDWREGYVVRKRGREIQHNLAQEVLRLRRQLRVQTERMDNLVVEAHRQLDTIRNDLQQVSACKCQRHKPERLNTSIGIAPNSVKAKRSCHSRSSGSEDLVESGETLEGSGTGHGEVNYEIVSPNG
ncbi:hypothetical protein K435DRAFT_838757, partial [Dendrothele bispora CBS 962.96]